VSRSRFTLALSCALAAWCALPSRAVAQTATGLTLTWEAPPECPDAPSLRRSIAEARGHDFAPNDRALDVRAVVTRTGSRWHAALATRTGSTAGERALDATTCARLTQGVAMVIALAMDAEPDAPPDTAQTTSQPVSLVTSPPVIATTPPTSTTVTPPIVRVPPAPRTRWRWELEARLLGDSRALPEFAPGVSLGLRALRGSFGLRAELGALLPRTADGPRQGTGSDVGLAFANVRACVQTTVRWLRASFCGGAEWGVAFASSFGFARPSSSESFWVAALASPHVGVVLTRSLAIELTPDLVVPLVRPEYVVEGVGMIYQVPPWTVRVGLSVVWTPR
jgi:hypothetical protein